MKATNASSSQGSGKPGDSWEVAIATRLVKKAQLEWDCLRSMDRDDLVQECLCHWYRNKHKYNPKRGASLRTFMARVVENKIKDIVDYIMAKKRKDEIDAHSLDHRVGEDQGSRTLGEETSEGEPREPAYDHASDIDRRLDVSQALEALTNRQKEICDLITDDELTMSDIAEKMGIHRSTLYDEMERIKRLFEREGLDVYLRKPPTH
jgi:RNA polymerase sigma-70 factor (ECF subfamily)